MRNNRLRGLYAITPDTADTAHLLSASSQVLAGGAAILQYRNKSQDNALRLEQALGLRALCRQAGALLIINDDVALAEEIEADGVHLGEHDPALVETRARLGERFIIGASCYNSLAAGQQACRDGASYIAFGSMYPSRTKPNARHAPRSLLHEARAIGLPVVAIGGITLENAAPLVQAGADALAVISALYESVDVQDSARRFSALFAPAE